MAMAARSWIAVDVGNRRMKFGWFVPSVAGGISKGAIPEPEAVLTLSHDPIDFRTLEAWLESVSRAGGRLPKEPQTDLKEAPQGGPQENNLVGTKPAWWIGSVYRPGATRLMEWLQKRDPDCRVVLLRREHIPIQVAVEEPDRVGVDRLLDAVGSNVLREADRPAVIVDVGSAITVDWVSAEGVFCGGAILPGLEMSARALHQFTDLLPEVSLDPAGEAPSALGVSTERAIRSGLFWGSVGAIRELIARLAEQSPSPPQVFLTGGAGATLAPHLGLQVQYIPHLTLAGIAITASASLADRE